MNRRQFFMTSAAIAAAPHMLFAQTPTASPQGGGTAPEFHGIPVSISPDGSRIAGTGGNKRELQVLDIAAGDIVTSDTLDVPIALDSIRWASDSSAVAFSLDSAVFIKDSDIYIMDAMTGDVTDLTDDDPDHTGADQISLTASPTANAVPVDLFPAWSPDSEQLVFTRTNWGSQPGGTTLMTIPREGGPLRQRAVLQPEYPMSVYSPMWWMKNNDILLSQWISDPEDKGNGIWLVASDDTVSKLISGDPDDGIPSAIIADVSTNGDRASVYSQLLLARFGANPGKVWFDVDLKAGTFTSWETSLGLATEPAQALAADGTGVLVAPPVFQPDGEDIAWMTRVGDGPVQVMTGTPGGSGKVIATFDPGQTDAVGNGATFGLDWAMSGDLMVVTPGGIAGILHP